MAKPPHIDGERGYLTLFFSLSKLPARYRYTTAHRWFHETRLLWLYGCTECARIVAHRSRSAQGRVHFINARRCKGTEGKKIHNPHVCMTEAGAVFQLQAICVLYFFGRKMRLT